MTLQSMGAEVVDEEIAEFAPWFHNLHLPDGRQTAPDHPLGDFPSFKWEQIAPSLGNDLTGQRALDIGCNAGFYTFELARRGAAVVAIDHDEHYLRQARWAASQLEVDDRVEFRKMGVYELAHAADESFDLVLFMGVLYHLRHPLLALDIVSERLRVGGRLVFQTLTLPGDERVVPPPDLRLSERPRLLEPGSPVMAFIEHRMADDPTNWWLANAAACEAMLRSAGFRVVREVAHETWLCEKVAADLHRAELDAATGRSTAAGSAPQVPATS